MLDEAKALGEIAEAIRQLKGESYEFWKSNLGQVIIWTTTWLFGIGTALLIEGFKRRNKLGHMRKTLTLLLAECG